MSDDEPLWAVYDRRTGKKIFGRVFLTQKRAEDAVTDAQNRHEHGIQRYTRDQLLNADVRRWSK